MRTWSDVVYDGTEVYRIVVISDSSGLSGESVCEVYMILSVHAGVRLRLERHRLDVIERAKESK